MNGKDLSEVFAAVADYLEEGVVDPEVAELLKAQGWTPTASPLETDSGMTIGHSGVGA